MKLVISCVISSDMHCTCVIDPLSLDRQGDLVPAVQLDLGRRLLRRPQLVRRPRPRLQRREVGRRARVVPRLRPRGRLRQERLLRPRRHRQVRDAR